MQMNSNNKDFFFLLSDFQTNQALRIIIKLISNPINLKVEGVKGRHYKTQPMHCNHGHHVKPG
jgi:hypothetical protein